MEDEIKVGNKVYKVADFASLGEKEFKKIYEYVINLENDIIGGKLYSNESVAFEQIKLVKNIREKLFEVQQSRMNQKVEEFLKGKKIDSVNEIDDKYNETIDNVTDVYNKTRGQVSEKVLDIGREKEELIDDLIANTPRRNLTKEDLKMIDEILEEYGEKTRSINTLDNQNEKLYNEQQNNVEAISDSYVQKAIINEPVKNKGFFNRIRDFIDKKLMPKRLEKRVYKEKEGKLRNIINNVKGKIEEAKKKEPKSIKNLKSRIKTSFALGMVALGMAGSAPSMFKDKEADSLNMPSPVQYEMSFDSIEDVSSFSALYADGDTIEFEAELDESKVNNLIEYDEAVYQEVIDIFGKLSINIKDSQIKSVIDKFLNIDSMQISDEEKQKLLLEYLHSNEDGLDESTKKDIISLYANREKNKELEENKVKEEKESNVKNKIEAETKTTVETKAKEESSVAKETKPSKEEKTEKESVEDKKVQSNNKKQEKTDYQELVELNKKIDSILSTAPSNSYKDTLTSNLKGTLTEMEISEILLNNMGDKNAIKQELSSKMLDKYLDELNKDERTEAEKERDELSEKYRKAYDVLDSIMSNPNMPFDVLHETLLNNLKDYIPESTISQLYNDWYFETREEENTDVKPTSNIEVYVTTEGDKYILGENGEQIFVTDDVIDQILASEENENTENTENKANLTDKEKKDILQEKLKERIMKSKDYEKDRELYEALNDRVNVSIPEKASDKQEIRRNAVENLKDIQDLVKDGTLDIKDVRNIVDSDMRNYEKVDALFDLISSGKEEASLDEETKELYKLIKDGVQSKNTKAFMDKLDDLVPLDAMEEIGIIEDDTIENILADEELTDKEKEEKIKDVIENGNETLEKLGYTEEVKENKNQKQTDDYER